MSEEDEGFDIHRELNNMVTENVLPKKVADRIEKKIMENNITITKEQFDQLIERILSILKNPEKTRRETSVNTMEKKTVIEEKISQQPPQETMLTEVSPRIVTTDELQIPDNKINPSKILQQDPLMEIPSDPESVIILMNWLQFLIDKCGRNNLREVLDYYVAIKWITEDVKFHLLEYSSGISEQKDGKERKNVRELPSQDHIQSFLFIQKLKGRNFDKHFLERINGEISRLVKQADL